MADNQNDTSHCRTLAIVERTLTWAWIGLLIICVGVRLLRYTGNAGIAGIV